MSSYIELPIETDPQDIMDDFVTFMQTIVPGWDASSGQLDTWLAQSMSLAAAESRDVASAVPRSIFRWFGASLIGLAPIDDVSASLTSTWTMKDNAGYTIPLGTQVSIARTGDEVYAFETVSDTVVAPGSTVANNVQLVAVTPGVASSGLGSVGGSISLLDPLSYVLTITQNSASAGGADAETDDEYLGRLTAQLQLLAPRPILPQDFAVFSRDIPGVWRATAIDGYNPVTATFGNARTVSVAGIDVAGVPLDAVHKATVQADLQARREVNFQVFVIDPAINLIDVTYTVKALAGYDLPTLVTSINAALTGYLSPTQWGTTAVDDLAWVNQTVLRYLEVASLINNVTGVDYITTTAGNYDLLIGIHGSGLVRTDVALTGVAPLPQASTLTGAAT